MLPRAYDSEESEGALNQRHLRVFKRQSKLVANRHGKRDDQSRTEQVEASKVLPREKRLLSVLLFESKLWLTARLTNAPARDRETYKSEKARLSRTWNLCVQGKLDGINIFSTEKKLQHLLKKFFCYQHSLLNFVAAGWAMQGQFSCFRPARASCCSLFETLN